MAIADLGAVFEQSLHRGNLVVRWLPVFVAALYVGIFIVIATALWWVREHTLQGAEQSAEALQKVHAVQMDNAMNNIDLTLRKIGHDSDEGKLVPSNAYLRSLIPEVHSSVSSLGVTDAAGKTIGAGIEQFAQ